jgi:hypothetical protein
MVCFRDIIVNTVHKVDNKDDNNNNNNNNYYYYYYYYYYYLLQLGCHPVAVVILHAYKI